jgi:hypothetical protein
MTDHPIKAVWIPAWYELDQSLQLGERKKFWFFDHPPDSFRSYLNGETAELVFFNQLDSTENCCVRYARIVEMVHPQLGALLKVDTDGLDYIFYPAMGEEIVVNAEELPGTIECELPHGDITDWTVYLKLSEVSEPTGELV